MRLVIPATSRTIIHPNGYLLVCIIYVANAPTPHVAMHMSASTHRPRYVKTLPSSAIVAKEQIVLNGMLMNVPIMLRLASAATRSVTCRTLIVLAKLGSIQLI